MFAFDLPKFASMSVALPTGGSAIFVHVGEGRFISNVPPIAMAGISAVKDEVVTGVPLGWDSDALPVVSHGATFVFDIAGAATAVEEAAGKGDTKAREIMDLLQKIEAEPVPVATTEPVPAAEPGAAE